MTLFLTYFNLFIDIMCRYGFKANSSAMDGLNKFFKIINKRPVGAYYVSHNMHYLPRQTLFLNK